MIPVLEIGGTHVTAALVHPAGAAAAGAAEATAAQASAAQTPAVQAPAAQIPAATWEVTGRARHPLDPHGDADAILGAVLRCAASLPAPPDVVWGVAVPGPFDYAEGVALYEGVGKFDGLHGTDVRAALLEGLPERPRNVLFRNDAHSFLAGEWRAGAARGHTRAVGITLGTGVGSAFLAGGRMCHDGPGVPPGGRVDLLRIDGRPLEDTVSRRALLARYGDRAADVRDIAERARAGERRARRTLDGAFHRLGAALGPYVRDFGSSVLVVGGSMARSWDLVGPALRAGLGHTPVTVRPSVLGDSAALIGAADGARRAPPGTAARS